MEKNILQSSVDRFNIFQVVRDHIDKISMQVTEKSELYLYISFANQKLYHEIIIID